MMFEALSRARDQFLSTGDPETPYECARCETRFERQPTACPECGCYQVNWVGWREEYVVPTG